MAVDRREKEEEQRERIAREAFDEVDEDGNGYIPIDELHGLTNSLGVPLAPEELDAALEELDEYNDGVLDRDAWIRWCGQRFTREQVDPTLEAIEGVVFDTKHSTASTVGDTLNGDIPGREIKALAERARRARRRASTDIHAAAWSGDLELVKDFLQHNPDFANAIDDSEFGMGYRPLHYAAYGGFLDVCRELRANGARVHAVGDNGVSALFLAAQAGKSDVVSFLLDLEDDDWFTRSSLAKIVLIPAVDVVEREQKVVSVRGLQPETEYRVQVAAVNATGFGPYGPASHVVRTSFESKNAGKAVENSGGSTATPRHRLSPLSTSRGKAKGRNVLAWEQRRKAAAEATRLAKGGGRGTMGDDVQGYNQRE